MTPLRNSQGEKIAWQGVLLSVQPRIRLSRRSNVMPLSAFQVRADHFCGGQPFAFRSRRLILQLLCAFTRGVIGGGAGNYQAHKES